MKRKFHIKIQKEHKLPILLILQAFLLTYICYIVGNIPYSISSGKETVKWFNTIATSLTNKDYSAPADVLAINVSYDKQLAEITDEYGMPLGVVDITDRSKLLRLLNLINKTGGYKHVICDIFLSNEYTTAADSSLFDLISKMPRISLAGNLDVSQIPEKIRSKAFLSGYNISINENDFVKYPLFTSQGKSLPLHIWETETGHVLKGYDFLCYGDGGLCQKSLFLDFPVRISETYSNPTDKQWLNMGTDILDVADMLNPEGMFKDKIILIGSVVSDDIHSTVVGDLPGVIIIYNAYKALVNGKHKVSLLSLIILFLLFYLTGYLIVKQKTIKDLLPGKLKPKSDVSRMIFSMISFSTIFTITFFLLYLIFGKVYDIFLISGYFVLFSTILDLRKSLK